MLFFFGLSLIPLFHQCHDLAAVPFCSIAPHWDLLRFCWFGLFFCASAMVWKPVQGFLFGFDLIQFWVCMGCFILKIYQIFSMRFLCLTSCPAQSVLRSLTCFPSKIAVQRKAKRLKRAAVFLVESWALSRMAELSNQAVIGSPASEAWKEEICNQNWFNAGEIISSSHFRSGLFVSQRDLQAHCSNYSRPVQDLYVPAPSGLFVLSEGWRETAPRSHKSV